MPDEQTFMTVAEVATVLRRHPLRVYALCADGTIPAVRLGRQWRIPRSAFARWLEVLDEQALAGTIAAPGRQIEAGAALASV